MIRRTAPLLLVALLTLALSPCARAASYALYSAADAKSALVTEAGDVRCAPGAFRTIFPVRNRFGVAHGTRFMASSMPGAREAIPEDEFYMLMDDQGRALTDADYGWIDMLDDDLFSVVTPDGMGIIDGGGRTVIPAQYTTILRVSDGGYLATRAQGDETSTHVIRIEPDGSAHDTGTLIDSAYIYPGDAPYAAYRSGLYGYLDAQGHWAIEPRYIWANSFSGGRAAATDSTGVGLIDAQGNWLIPAIYTSFSLDASDPSANLIAISEEKGVLLLNSDGALVMELAVRDARIAQGGLIVAYLDAGALLLAPDGTVLYTVGEQGYISCDLGDAFSAPGRVIISNGTYPNPKAWLGDDKGNLLSGPFSQLTPADAGAFVFTTGRVRDAVDPYTGVRQPILVESTARMGLLDADGAVILPARYDMLSALSPDRYCAADGTGWGMIDREGNWLTRFEHYALLVD